MSIYTEKIGQDLHLIEVSGPLNERQFEDVIGAFAMLAGQGVERVIVSLKEVAFIDSRGLAALVAGYKTFGRQPQNFRLAELSSQPRLVFDVTGFDQIFEICDTVTDALEADAGLLLDLRQPVAIPVSLETVMM